MWKSAPEIDTVIDSLPDVSNLQLLYSLATFWRDAVYPSHYAASHEWESATVLSSHGQAILNDLRPGLTDLPEADVQLAYFGTFSHHELFFDFEKTDSVDRKSVV